MMKRIVALLTIAVVLLGAIAIVAFTISKRKQQFQLSEYQRIYEVAGELLESNRPDEALDLLETHFKPKLSDSELKFWPERMAQASIDSHNYSYLEHIVGKYPNTLLTNEEAALWWIRAQMHRRLWSKVYALIDEWPEERRVFVNRWKLLYADHAMLSGELDRALESLKSWNGDRHDEVNRQLRIALLAGDDQMVIGEALTKAYEAMPASPDLRSTAAQYFERAGRLAFARREYVAAFLLAPENPFHADQLANFYLRTLALPQAIETWRQSYEKNGDPRAWWNVWFWERVTLPRAAPLQASSGNWWGNLTLSLEKTGADAFLADALYQSDIPPIVQPEESYHWLIVLEALRRGNEAKALEVLEAMPQAAVPLAEDLRTVLSALLDWRVRGDWPRGLALTRGQLNHRFLRLLEDFRPAVGPADLDEMSGFESFLASEYAVGTVLLANGWLSAADRLLPDSLVESASLNVNQLDWLPFAYCKMRARLYGPSDALGKASAFPNDPSVNGLVAEMLLASGQIQEGFKMLEKVSVTAGASGYRAAYLLALGMFERRDFVAMEELIDRREDLANSVSGLELMARAAQQQGDLVQALEIYESLGEDSIEGCVYRYRAAILNSDKESARELLLTLLRLAPNEPRFHRWMKELDSENG